VVSGDDNGKIGPASMVYPNSATIRAPAIASGASCIAELAHEAHFAAARVDVAGVLSHVVGVAVKPLLFAVSAVLVIMVLIRIIRVCDDSIVAVLIAEIPVRTDTEICAASVVYPDTVVVSAPTGAFDARRLTVLRYQAHPASRIQCAGVPSSVLRAARKHLCWPVLLIALVAVLVLVIPAPADGEIRAASVVYPDTFGVRAPTAAFGARRLAVLPDQLHSAARIHGAGMPSSVVRVASNRGLGQGFLWRE